MKVAIISEYNVFTTVGGTEYYVDMLIKGLLEKGHIVSLITMGIQKNGVLSETISHKTFSYQLFFLPARLFANAEISQRVVSSTWPEILPVLKKEQPDIVHVHTYSTFFNIRHFEQCKKVFNNLFFTSHVPGHFCPKGDMIKMNKKPCEGTLSNICSVCLFTTGIKNGLANLINAHWKQVLDRLQKMDSLGIGLVCVSEWQKQQAILNGFTANRIEVIRQAIVTQNDSLVLQKNNRAFTIGYLGRLSAEKGAALLMEVISHLLLNSNFNFVLGIPLKNSTEKYVSMIYDLAQKAGDRIGIMNNVSATNKAPFFQAIDCLLIPSFFIETGPIVLLEALLYHTQVVAPAIGGPVEFKETFNTQITLYKWNKLASVIHALEEVSTKKVAEISNANALKEKEIAFINLHELLYQKTFL